MSEWKFEGKLLVESEIPEKAIAFLYLITHLESGRWYVGRKNLHRRVTKNVKVTKVVKGVKVIKVKKQRSLVSSDWKNYWSSSDYLKRLVKELGANKFEREILIFVETAAATIYSEESILYMSGAMFDPLCINGHIRTKIMRKWFENKESNLHERLKKLPIFN